MTHAVCTPGQRRAHYLYWTLNPLLGLRTGIEVARIGCQDMLNRLKPPYETEHTL